MVRLKTLRHDVKIKGKRILLRLDLNVPIEVFGRSVEVADDSRIVEAVPAIVRLHRAGARTIIITHLGEPGGKVVPKLRLHPVAMALRRHLPPSVTLIEHTSWDWNRIHKAAATLRPGEVLLLENIRFCKGEEANDKKFAE